MRARILPSIVLLAALALPTLAWAPLARAQQDAGPQAEEEPIDIEALHKERAARLATQQINRRISRYMLAATEAVDEDNPERARELLEKLNFRRLTPYERALIYRLLAYVAYSMADYEGAIENFEKVLAEEVLRVSDDDKVRFSIAQLHAALEHWEELIAALHRWMRYVAEPDPLGFYLMAIAYYQLQQFEPSQAWAERAVDAAEKPAESWLQLLAALYVQKEDYANAQPVLEELVMRFPKKAYWVQLSLIYGARDNYRHSLAVQQIAYEQGLLSEDSELRRLARSYLFHNLPYPAARVMEKGLAEDKIEPDAKAYEMLANSWIAAREFDRSYEPLQRAAELSDSGDLYVRLGQVQMQREEWRAAVDLFQKAIAKGDLKSPGIAQLLLGICYYNDERVGRARSAFALARKHDATRNQADQWLTHIENESPAT